MYGVKGEYGDLKLKPQLLKEQFENGEASATCMFNGKNITVTYKNDKALDVEQYSVKEIYIDGNKYGDCDTVLKEDVMKLNDTVNIVAILD